LEPPTKEKPTSTVLDEERFTPVSVIASVLETAPRLSMPIVS
jgi:hypothetical protein